MATQQVGFFDPVGGNNGQTSFLPGFRGLPRNPGESEASYQARLQQAQAEYQRANADRKQVTDLAGSEEAQSRKILDEQKGVQKQRLNDLAALLAKQTDQQFNRNIPDIAETAQGKGFLETSGFGDALAGNYTELIEDQNNQIARQGLTDRDLEIGSLGKIGENNNSLSTSGLQRSFSVSDNARAEELARELGRMGVPAPTPQPSSLDKGLQYAGPILSGVGAVKGAS